MDSFNKISAIENRMFFYLCVFAATISMPKEISNTMLALVLGAIIHRLIIKRDDVAERIRKYRPLLFMVLAIWGPIILSVFTHSDVMQNFIYFIRVPFFYTTGLLAVVFFVRDRKRLMLLWGLSTLSIFMNDVYGIWQFCQNSILFDVKNHDYGRFSGWLQYMVQATQITMWFPGAVMILTWIISQIKKRNMPSDNVREYCQVAISNRMMINAGILLSIAIFLAAVAFLVNGTRGAWLATIVLTVFLPFFTVRKKLRYIIVLLCIVGLGCGYCGVNKDNIFVNRMMSTANVNDPSQHERVNMWTGAYRMYMDNPVLGVGYEHFSDVYNPYYRPKESNFHAGHAHNNFLHTMAEQGTVGLLGMLAMIAIGTYAGFRSHIRSSRIFGVGSLPSISALCFLAVLWGAMLHGLSEYTFGASITLKVFWFLMAVFYVYCEECNQDTEQRI